MGRPANSSKRARESCSIEDILLHVHKRARTSIHIASTEMVSCIFRPKCHLNKYRQWLQTALEMFKCLVENGCRDLSSRINFSWHPYVAVPGGSFGDIWRGEMDTGEQVAVKCLRFHTIAEHHKKKKGFKVST